MITSDRTHLTENTAPKTSNVRAQVLVVEGHPLVREGLTRVLTLQKDLACCGQAATAAEALAAVESGHPDLAILDWGLRGNGVVQLIKSLRARFPDLLLLVLSQYDEPVHMENALQAGAHGYLLKERAVNELLDAIRTILSGKTSLNGNRQSQRLELPQALPSTTSLR